MEANNLFMQYIMRFGAEELPPRMQMPVEQQTDEFYNASVSYTHLTLPTTVLV